MSTPASRHHKRPRGEGQWALGYREPLNKNEENKKNDDGLNVRQRIIDIYSKRGFDSIDPADLRGRFRWYGLYTQRKPGIDGGKTAILEPEELDDRYFMLRVRIDGGQLDLRPAAHDRRHLQRRTPAAPPTSPTGRTSSCTGSRSRTCPAIWERAGGGRACPPPRRAATPRASSSAARWPGSTPTRSSTPPPQIARDPRAVHRRPGVLQPAAQVQDGASAAARRSAPCTRSTTSRSSAWSTTQRRDRATTCGSAAACPPTRCSPSGSACSSGPTRSPRSGPA